MSRRSKFTPHQIETAVLVMMESRIVKSWVESQGKFLEIDFSTPVGQEFLRRETRIAAERVIK